MRLRRGDVLEGALAELDDAGLDGLTMPALARRLGVRTGALYWHYADKAALIDAMAEAVIAGLDYADDPTAAWGERLLRYAQALHAALLARRDGARLVAGTFVARSNTVDAGHVLVSVVEASGLDPTAAAIAALPVFYYVLGYTIEEQARLRMSDDGRWLEHQKRVREIDPTATGEALSLSRDQDTFDHGVGLIISGIRLQAACRC